MKDRLWHVKSLGCALIVGALYFALIHASLALRIGPKDISFFWAPAGFLLGVLTRCRLRFWWYLIPILLAINIIANLLTGRPLTLVLLFTVDDILVPAGAAWILRRFLNDEEPFATATQAIAFLVITGFYAVISASLGVGAMFWQGLPGPYVNEWRIWATSVLMGVLILAPPMLSFSFDVMRALSRRRIIEGIGVQFLLIVPTYLAFHQHIASGMPVRLLVYASIPLLIWSALRAGVFGTSISLFVIGAVGVWQIATGDAVLGQNEAELTDNLGWVQAYFAAVSFSSLMVASLFSEFQQSLADRKLQSSVLSMIAAGKPLDATLRELILRIEARLPGMTGSVLLFDPMSKTLSTIAGPHLPQKYNDIITRFPAGPQNGSCGTAAFRKERVIVEDIFNSELWVPYLALAREFNLAACWSQPILNSANQVDGTFAMYYHQPRKPTPAELDLIAIAADLAEVAIERDHFISEIRDRERSYAALISNLSGMVYRFKMDENRTPLYMSDGALPLTGYSAAEMMAGVVRFRDLVHPDDLPRLTETTRQRIVTREPISLEFRIRTRNGREKWVWIQSTVRYDDAGTPTEVEGFCTEITARKRAELALDAARQTAEQASKAKDQFLAMLSHELRTPLTPVLLYVSMMEKQSDLPDDTRAEMKIIKTQIEQETRLIDDLLDVTRIDRGKFRIDKKKIDLRKIIDHVLELNSAAMDEKDLSLHASLEASSHQLFADPSRMQQLVINLLSNAIKFCKPNGTIWVSTLDAPNDRLRLEVRDTGIGIGAEELKKLFNPFEQGLRARSPEYGGLGLGLTIVKAITDLHGGSVRVESEGEDKGTTVSVELPVLRDATIEPSSETVRPIQSPKHLKIMVVEDHDASRDVIVALLKSLDHQAFGVASVAAALEKIAEPIDLLVSDIQLSDGTGLSLLQQFKKHQPVPAIALSGLGTDADIERSLAAGFKAHLIKPIDIDVLEKTIAEVIAG